MNWRLLLAIVLIAVGALCALIGAYILAPGLALLLGGGGLAALGLLAVDTRTTPQPPGRDPLTLQRRREGRP